MVLPLAQLMPTRKTCGMCLHSARSQSLACVGGLTTTVLPAMSAGAILLTARLTGSANGARQLLRMYEVARYPWDSHCAHKTITASSGCQ